MQNISASGVSVNKLSANGSFQSALPDNFIFEQVDPSLDDDDSDSDNLTLQVNQGQQGFQPNVENNGLKPGKKTKGRVKIKMEFIENKLRRYTTFSKRKTGIMKKAYELSTLTGTQVMLLVASETGHVYTFATRKLQPMITSDSGKALIQTCLNSPDPPPGTPSGNVLEQRMNPSGFEETELSYAVGEEDQKVLENSGLKPVFPIPHLASSQQQETVSTGAALSAREISASQTVTQISQLPSYQPLASHTPMVSVKEQSAATLISKTSSTNNMSGGAVSTNTNANSASSVATMQIPLILSQGGTLSMFQPSGQAAVGQTITVTQASQTQNMIKPTSVPQVVSAISAPVVSSSQVSPSGELNTPLPASTPSALSIMQGMTPGIVMYHTPQGIVYATPTQNPQDRTIFNFQQPATAISMTQSDQASAGQQIITIPVPVSLGGTPLLHLAPPPSGENSSSETTQMQPPPVKKAKK